MLPVLQMQIAGVATIFSVTALLFEVYSVPSTASYEQDPQIGAL